MTYPLPEGEHLRRAVKWISQTKQIDPETPLYQLIDQATFRFDLNPKDAEYITAFFRSGESLE
jgi:hypothetical protein